MSTAGNLRTLDSPGGVKRDRTFFVTIGLLFLSSTERYSWVDSNAAALRRDNGLPYR